MCSLSTFYIQSFYRVFNFLCYVLTVSPEYSSVLKLSTKPSLSHVCCYPVEPVVFVELPHVFFYMISEREA